MKKREKKEAVKKPLKLKSGETVIDRRDPALQTTTPKQLRSALRRITGGRGLIQAEITFSKNIGSDNCVQTKPDDEIVWAVRAGSRAHRFTRFVKGREAVKTKVLTVVLQRAEEEGVYAILVAYAGRRCEPEPRDPRATKHSVAFWKKHALVWGSVPVVAGTETSSLQAEVKNSVSKDDLALIQAWVMVEQKALEWCVGRHTWQIALSGQLYERHFHAGSHPTRSNRSKTDVLVALNSATTPIQLYRGEKGGEEAMFFADAAYVLSAAKAWLDEPRLQAELAAAKDCLKKRLGGNFGNPKGIEEDNVLVKMAEEALAANRALQQGHSAKTVEVQNA